MLNLKIYYVTSGFSGSGRIVRGISIGNALRRNKVQCEYTIISGSGFSFLADAMDIPHIEIPLENPEQFSRSDCRDTVLYQTITGLEMDLLLIDLIWFPFYNFIHELSCKKIFLCRQVDDCFFNMHLPYETRVFRPDDFGLVLSIEPFNSSIPMKSINPIVIRNHSEIFSRDDALSSLGLNPDKRVCILSYSGHPGDFERVKRVYSYLEDEGFQMVYTTNYRDGIFPVVDYFNAADLIICGAGYNSFWEVNYFNKEAIIVPTFARFESGKCRIEECQEYYFNENGADQLVDIILNL